MKQNLLTLLLCGAALMTLAQPNHVFSPGEAIAYGPVNLATAGAQGWSTDRAAIPGYFSAYQGATYTGASDAANVNGYVKKYGNDAFVFPVGTGTDLRTLSMSAPSLATEAYATAWILGNPTSTTDPTAPNAGLHPVSAVTVPIIAVSPVGQWDWQATSGNGVGLTITVSIPDMTVFSPANSLRLVGWNGTSWIDLSGSNTASGNTENSTLSGTMVAGITAVGIGSAYLTLRLKVLLEGAVLGNSAGLESTMRDELRNSPFTSLRYIPDADPYTFDPGYATLFTKVGDGANPAYQTVLNPGTMFNSRGTLSATDWIFIQLRSKTNPATILGTRSAIVQRDGTVVDIDGNSAIRFPSMPADDYYISVRHRNHLGTMTAAPLPAATFNSTTLIDFTTMSSANLWNNAGYDGMEQATLSDGKRALWAGNANGDNKVKYQGGGNDRTFIQSDVVNFPANTTLNINYDQAIGYFQADINMDSKAKYQGSGNDRTLLQSLVLGYLLNTALNINYDLFLEQLP
ncbi:MAG: hypothetical protein V4722_05440 [Bacteroidota bacterium]